MPNLSDCRISQADRAARMSVLLGTQPVQVQSPPSRPDSMMAVLRPSLAANLAAVSPADPPPITTKS